MKTPEQRKRENRQALIAVALFFGIPILIALIGFILSGGKSTTNTQKSGRCSTITEPYSNVEHNVYCEGDYDAIEQQIQSDIDWGYQLDQEAQAEYEAELKQEEYERMEAEYWENYCNQNPYDC